ncbi:MAG: glycosyltransferase [Desulfosoma sp.]
MEKPYDIDVRDSVRRSLGSIHILGSRQYGGADRFYVRLVKALASRGHPVLAVNRPGSPVNKALENVVPQRCFRMMNGLDVYSMWQIRRLIQKSRYPIVQTYMGRATRLTRIPKGLPVVHIARLGGYYKINGYYRHAHAWVGNTKGICDYLVKEGLPATRVFFVGNFVETPRTMTEDELSLYRQQWKIPREAFVILALGRFVPKKGFQDLLQAISLRPNPCKDRPVVWILAGDGPMRNQLEETAVQLGIQSFIRFVGWQNDPAVVYNLADLLICPSRHEPLGNVILEAWSYGVPVLSTRTAGALELIEPNENGFLVDVEKPEQWASFMAKVADFPQEDLRKIGVQGMKVVEERYSEQAIVEAYESLYEQLSASRGLLP